MRDTVGGLGGGDLVQIELLGLDQTGRHLGAGVELLPLDDRAGVLVHECDRDLVGGGERIPERPQVHRAVEERHEQDDHERQPGHPAPVVALDVAARRECGKHVPTSDLRARGRRTGHL